MRDLDMKISKKVAEEAGEQIKNLKKQLNENKDAHIALLNDVIQDSKDKDRFLRKLINILVLVIFLLSCGIIGLYIYSQEKFADFVSDCEFESVKENIMYNDNNSLNYGNFSVVED